MGETLRRRFHSMVKYFEEEVCVCGQLEGH